MIRFSRCVCCLSALCMMLSCTVSLWSASSLFETDGVRLKDLITIAGERDNQLMGFGVVVGLSGTGDKGQATVKMIQGYLNRHGMNFTAADIASKNMAFVSVTAELPHSAKTGTRLLTRVACVGDATSLRGGELLQTPLIAADENIYAVAQGQLSIGGYGNAGPNMVTTGIDHPSIETVATQVPGAIVEFEVPRKILFGNSIHLNLKNPDYTTVTRIASSLIDLYGAERVIATDSATVELHFVGSPSEMELTQTIAELQQLRVVPDMVAKVVINPRTGTIVIGKDVQISQVAVSQGGLSLKVLPKNTQQRDPNGGRELVDTTVWQMEPATGDKIEFKDRPEGVNIDTDTVPGGVTVLEGTTVEAISNALNALGARPRDIVALFQALHAAGALHAELVIL